MDQKKKRKKKTKKEFDGRIFEQQKEKKTVEMHP